jgi:hypothetical protein
MSVRHITLTANTVATVNFGKTLSNVAVFHTGNQTADVHVTLGPVDPVADANDTYVVPSGCRRTMSGPTTVNQVRLRSTAAVNVEVEY